mmetsp:Transcript_57915/g.123128  ORF Transcript_57915/g.123128 Transcript_57915/m.123128 type:complete len:91 (-) Transcript_57915:36-308(-)
MCTHNRLDFLACSADKTGPTPDWCLPGRVPKRLLATPNTSILYWLWPVTLTDLANSRFSCQPNSDDERSTTLSDQQCRPSVAGLVPCTKL